METDAQKLRGLKESADFRMIFSMANHAALICYTMFLCLWSTGHERCKEFTNTSRRSIFSYTIHASEWYTRNGLNDEHSQQWKTKTARYDPRVHRIMHAEKADDNIVRERSSPLGYITPIPATFHSAAKGIYLLLIHHKTKSACPCCTRWWEKLMATPLRLRSMHFAK